jgi:hypothetical protein
LLGGGEEKNGQEHVDGLPAVAVVNSLRRRAV